MNRELACLRSMLNRIVEHSKIDLNPIRIMKLLPENNVRERILTDDEFEVFLNNSPQHLAPVIIVAYYTGMRRSEILKLTWDNVDLDRGFIRLYGSMTMTEDGRVTPMHPSVQKATQDQPKGLHTNWKFLHNDHPVNDVKRRWTPIWKSRENSDIANST